MPVAFAEMGQSGPAVVPRAPAVAAQASQPGAVADLQQRRIRVVAETEVAPWNIAGASG